jgi:hypothetical protein
LAYLGNFKLLSHGKIVDERAQLIPAGLYLLRDISECFCLYRLLCLVLLDFLQDEALVDQQHGALGAIV